MVAVAVVGPLDDRGAVVLDALEKVEDFAAEGVDDELARARGSFVQSEPRLLRGLGRQEEPSPVVGVFDGEEGLVLPALEEIVGSVLDDAEGLVVAVVPVPDDERSLSGSVLSDVNHAACLVRHNRVVLPFIEFAVRVSLFIDV